MLLFSTNFFDATRALQMRLVDEVAEDARDSAAALAETIAGRSQLAVQASKELVDMASRGEPLDERHQHWHELSGDCGESAEGVSALLQRRRLNFPYRA
ncbi:hypothetical protein AB0I53_25500 [Saccharopolyspora sp. NPDC050389]|uniref:enoyl-CoA hydratase/isomerase family protein n=1 Tax=Saccharopolyspora sp. NPDC050389 TaxID=3155516 RepID=UPI0033C81B49